MGWVQKKCEKILLHKPSKNVEKQRAFIVETASESGEIPVYLLT